MMSDMSARQRAAWVWAARLAQAAAILPAVAAQTGGWVAPVLALPVVWATDRLLMRVCSGGLAQEFCRLLGGRVGGVLTIIYMVWGVVLGSAQLRMGVGRVEAAANLPAAPWVLTAAVVLLALWMVRGKVSACARWAVMAFGGVMVVLGAIALLALGQLRWEYLRPVPEGGSGLPGAVGVTFALLCVGVYGCFAPGDGGHVPGGYPASVCVLLSGLLLTVQGNLGPALAARLEDPLLTLSRNVGVEGAFQRAESLLAAALLLADLALLTLLLWAARWTVGRWWPAVGAAMFAAAVLPLGAVQEQWLCHGLVPAGNFGFGLVIPLLLLAVGRIKDRKTGAHIVPESGENGIS